MERPETAPVELVAVGLVADGVPTPVRPEVLVKRALYGCGAEPSKTAVRVVSLTVGLATSTTGGSLTLRPVGMISVALSQGL